MKQGILLASILENKHQLQQRETKANSLWSCDTIASDKFICLNFISLLFLLAHSMDFSAYSEWWKKAPYLQPSTRPWSNNGDCNKTRLQNFEQENHWPARGGEPLEVQNCTGTKIFSKLVEAPDGFSTWSFYQRNREVSRIIFLTTLRLTVGQCLLGQPLLPEVSGNMYRLQ